MDVRYSLFSELFTRGTRPQYPTTLQEAHKEIERFGPNDTRWHKKEYENSRVYVTKSGLVCDFCTGRQHVEKDCLFKKNSVSQEDARKQIEQRRAKYANKGKTAKFAPKAGK